MSMIKLFLLLSVCLTSSAYLTPPAVGTLGRTFPTFSRTFPTFSRTISGRSPSRPPSSPSRSLSTNFRNTKQQLSSSSKDQAGISNNSQLQKLSCRAWMWQKEKKIKINQNGSVKDSHTISKLVNNKSFYLTETENLLTFISIVDFLENGEIRFRASEVPDLRLARGTWTLDSDGIILKMVIDHIYNDGNFSKAHYLGVINDVHSDGMHKSNFEKDKKKEEYEIDNYDEEEEEDSLLIGGEICEDRCDIDDNNLKIQFELSRAGNLIIISKEKKFEENFI